MLNAVPVLGKPSLGVGREGFAGLRHDLAASRAVRSRYIDLGADVGVELSDGAMSASAQPLGGARAGAT
jgi:hypothetical protein